MVASASGKVHVLAAVKSADVIVPVKGLIAVVLWGFIAIESELAVLDENSAEFVVERVVVIDVPLIAKVSLSEPKFIVSAVVSSVARFNVFPAVPVPIFIIFALFPVPKLTVPVVPESKVIPEVVVEDIVPAPAKVNAVALVVIVSIEATPVKAPAVVTFRPPLDVKAKVPEELPIAVFEVPDVFIFAVPPDTVSPAEPVNNPAEVIVPLPLVEIFPLVVTASPLFVGESVVPILFQYPIIPVLVGSSQVKFPLPSFFKMELAAP